MRTLSDSGRAHAVGRAGRDVLLQIAADLVLVVHLLFIGFVLFGGLLVLRWPKLAWLHVPAFAWGALIELAGWVCPLTPLENALRRAAGEAGYQGGFIEHYLLAVIYPNGLTRGVQLVLAAVVIAVNAALYARLLQLLRRRGNTVQRRSAGSATR